MLENCLTVIAADGSLTVCRLEEDLDIDHRTGDLIPSHFGDSQWRVEEIAHEERWLVVSEIAVVELVVAEFEPDSVELLAA
jgi:hypothetical protein